MNKALVIGLLGAESTGKTTLSRQLAQALRDHTGLRCAVVDEHLRAWCERQQRTPRGNEQRQIATTQHERIAEAAASHDIVVADTTALMTAAYSRLVWNDDTLDAWAAQLHLQSVHLTLLTALDLPWVPDGLQRDGPHVREPVDALLRALLAAHGIAWSRIGGLGGARVEQAMNAVTATLNRHLAALADRPPSAGLFTRLAERDAALPKWQTACEYCDDPHCEQALFVGKFASKPTPT
jgi:nicotinamide riboside kinase